jgi:peptidyl-prolyl cis-trans isomerase SDCCAG10
MLKRLPFSDARKAQIEEMQAKIRRLDKRRAGSDSDDSDDDAPRKKRSGPSFLDQELAKYSAGRRGKRSGKKDEDDVLSALSSFTGKIRKAGTSDAVRDEDDKESEETRRLDDDTGGLEIDDDIGFMSHALKATKEDDAEQTRRAESDYTVSIVFTCAHNDSRCLADILAALSR